jgi:hypothetical protein
LETERLLKREHRRWNLTKGYFAISEGIEF